MRWVGMLSVVATISALTVVGAGLPVAAQAPPGAKQSVQGGGVTVDVTFLKERADAPAFRGVLATHSVNLDDYRLEGIVRLRDGRGGELAPAGVEGATGSGHHREATVRFAWPDPRPKVLEVNVKGVAAVPERLFRWSSE